MRVFLYEHITGGGCLGSALPEALLPEAIRMVRSLASDLAAVPGVEVVSLADPRSDYGCLAVERHVVHDGSQWQDRFDELLRAADAVWLIAPETDGVLERLSRRVVDAGRPLLGSRPEAVRIAGSKYATACVLMGAGIPVISTFRAEQTPDRQSAAWVVKPDDGCGCEDIWLFDDVHAARSWIGEQRQRERYVLQPYIDGESASLSVLARDGEAWLLSVNRQRIVMHDQPRPSVTGATVRTAATYLSFNGCLVNAIVDEGGRLQRLAKTVAKTIPGLWGYFGIDLILAQGGPVVIEVNPRLTTSYAGLPAALGVNPAALVLGLFEDRHPFALPPLGGCAVAVEH